MSFAFNRGVGSKKKFWGRGPEIRTPRKKNLGLGARNSDLGHFIHLWFGVPYIKSNKKLLVQTTVSVKKGQRGPNEISIKMKLNKCILSPKVTSLSSRKQGNDISH